MQGREARGIYQFNVYNSRNYANKECNVSEIKQKENCKKFDVWHYKLGHPSVKIVRQILNDNNISVDNISIPYACTYCQMGKSHKLSFSISETT